MTYKTVIEQYTTMAAQVDGNDHFIIGAMASEINELRQALIDIQSLPNCDSYMARTIARKAFNHGT